MRLVAEAFSGMLNAKYLMPRPFLLSAAKEKASGTMPRLSTVTRSPVFVARISLMRKMVKRGNTTATKWHSLQDL
jgi:hypothetical protein